ncbi:MAG: hypothetical protein R2806_10460 [Saprospiraceae bacterium]
MSELLIGLGANYDERLLIGATVNIPFVNYEVRKTYQEDDDQNEVHLIFSSSNLTNMAYRRVRHPG